MFIATLTRKNDRNSPYVAELKKVTRYKRGTGEPAVGYRWSDFVSKNGREKGGYYELYKRTYATHDRAVKAVLKDEKEREKRGSYIEIGVR